MHSTLITLLSASPVRRSRQNVCEHGESFWTLPSFSQRVLNQTPEAESHLISLFTVTIQHSLFQTTRHKLKFLLWIHLLLVNKLTFGCPCFCSVMNHFLKILIGASTQCVSIFFRFNLRGIQLIFNDLTYFVTPRYNEGHISPLSKKLMMFVSERTVLLCERATQCTWLK